ncbi:MAG: radical SAM family heme chaperone HemW [Butyrivibrio sp.]|nr:radical SAM family heme chaperone HemW [Butyrivibrio sp.]
MNLQYLSIYVHIPFCVRKCNYCDFLSFNAKRKVVDRYFEALKREVELIASKNAVVRSIFFGGGTPSFVDADKICDVLRDIKSSFAISEDAEISIEVNPASAMFEKLCAYRKAGFNRISIGAQSLNDEELKVLGRAHDSKMFFETFENARRAGFDNINVDVMSALPGQSLESYLATLGKVIELRPEHISAYSLILEEGTPFYEMDLDIPDEDTDRAMYHETKRILAEAGYHRYEISNYALDGRECYHNKVYWRRGNYLGLGIGAASMIDNKRWSNTRDIERYVGILLDGACADMEAEIYSNAEADLFDKDNDMLPGQDNVGTLSEIRENIEELSLQSQMEEFMFLGLRLVEGVSIAEFRRLFGKDIQEVYGEVIDKYIKLGMMEYSEQDSFLCLTDSGLDVSNTVMAEFLL